jgi:hypothetical protein
MPPVATAPAAPEDDVAANNPPDDELRQPPRRSTPPPSPLASTSVSFHCNDVRHIAVPSPTRSFETLVYRPFQDSAIQLVLDYAVPIAVGSVGDTGQAAVDRC